MEIEQKECFYCGSKGYTKKDKKTLFSDKEKEWYLIKCNKCPTCRLYVDNKKEEK